MAIIQTILNLGAPVMMPIIICILGLVVGMPLIKSLRSGFTVGVGFIGINLVTGLMGQYMGPLISALNEKWSLSLDIADLGWPVSSGIAFSNGSFVVAMFAVLIIINLVMLMSKLTNTLNVDIWNFWHFIMGGSIAYALTGNFTVGCIAGGLYGGAVLLFADNHEKRIQEFLGYPGVTITTSSFPVTLYICMGIDWLIDHIPGVKEIKFSLTSLNPKIAFLGEPIFLGFILGMILTAIGGFAWQECITAGVSLAAVMHLLPRMVKILMEGLAPISNAAQEFMSNHFPGRKVNIGMDLAILLGDAEVITLAMIMIPITLILSVTLPGNKLLPFTDLPALTYFMVAPVMAARRNSFRSIVIGIILISIMLYIATDFAPLFTSVAHASKLVDASQTSVSALSAGGEIIAWVITKIISIFA